MENIRQKEANLLAFNAKSNQCYSIAFRVLTKDCYLICWLLVYSSKTKRYLQWYKPEDTEDNRRKIVLYKMLGKSNVKLFRLKLLSDSIQLIEFIVNFGLVK